MVNKKRVPDRWKDYKPCSWTPIENERIISFKTPLAKKFITEIADDEGLIHSERFTPTDLINELDKRDLHLGLVLDFTFTKRYYDPTEFTNNGIIYHKMMCPGHEIPKEKDIKRFKYKIYSFLESDKTGALVGVHCTHGVNRTGYMVCRYLIDCKGYEPEDAIKAFNDARGYPIERENYLEDLKSREPGHDVDFEECIEEFSSQDKNMNEREEEQPRSYREHNRKRKFHREENWADDYEVDFNSHERHARIDQYYDQYQGSYRLNNEEYHSHPRKSRNTRSQWNQNYDRRNNHAYDGRTNYGRRYDPYYPPHRRYHASELDQYENGHHYRWQRRDRNSDSHREGYKY